MNKIAVIILTGMFCARSLPAAPPPGYQLAWAEEFDGPALNTNLWSYETGPRKSAINTPDAVCVSNGCLTISTSTRNGFHFTGMITTRHRFAEVHGYWESRIQFSDQPGEWSAFWLQGPANNGKILDDTAKSGTEIDICEHRCRDIHGSNIINRVQHTLHWNGYGKYHKSVEHLSPDMNLASGFHTYGCEVTAQGYKFFIDDRLTWTTNVAATDVPEFVLLSSEVSTNRWAGKIPAVGYEDKSSGSTRVAFDYVRYYQPVK